MAILADARPCAHTAPPRRRLIAAYGGPISGLRAALLSGAALVRPAAGGAR
ncbi:hypothetical protein [Micromonospora carbonacea]|uniref:Uncharacterized protein n=1 Tax=Micromonospora carbonacea TaxID=47853 RepID=A0A1C4X0N9_9ACTN|nr:hypothetical protein [Micromonospora carbonacea]SCF02016.1 hypothetical protein GA0070563_104150 [Micromonospora carbonacea]